MIAQLLRMIGFPLIINLTLLITIFGSLVWGLASVVRGLERGLISILILLCIGLVMLLNRIHLSNGRAAVILSLSGGIGIVYYFAGLSNPMGAIIRWMSTFPGTLIVTHTWPDISSLMSAWQQLFGQLGGLANRTIVWISTLFTGQSGFDIVAASFTWGVIFWLITAWASWGVIHLRRPLPAIAPAGLLLSAALNYANGSAIVLLPFLAATLLLMAHNRYEAEEHYWQQKRIDYAEDIRLDMALMIPLLVLGLIILATFTPPLSIKHLSRLAHKIAEPYQSQADNVAETLGIDQASGPLSSLDSLRSPGLPQQHLVGAASVLPQQLVMTIQTGDLPSLATMELLPHPPEQYYWRSITYDVYTGRGWATSPTETIQYLADRPAVAGLPPGSSSIRLVDQSVQFAYPGTGVLFVTGLLVKVNIDYEVAWRMPIAEPVDIFGVTTQGERYQATSLLVTPSIAQLRAATGRYPDLIRQRYLALPETIPQRVYDLAMDLTRGQITPYDRAASIEAYLRRFPYTLDVPEPPPNQDVVDYFLFDLRQGYCDYYATAMVVLSRVAGLPARLVSGYATGTYDPPNARFLVTADNAHSWAEIFFSGIGWVEFEPTGGSPAINRPTDQVDTMLSIPEPKPVLQLNVLRLIKDIPWSYWFMGIFSTFLLITVIIDRCYVWRLHHLPSQQLLVVIYQQMIHVGIKLSVDWQPGDTPYEYAAHLHSFLLSLTSKRYLFPLISPMIGIVERIIQLYNRAMFSPHGLSATEHKQVARDWLQLRWRLKVARLLLL